MTDVNNPSSPNPCCVNLIKRCQKLENSREVLRKSVKIQEIVVTKQGLEIASLKEEIEKKRRQNEQQKNERIKLESINKELESGLADLELWCAQAKPEYAGSAWEELKHIRQGVGFLVIFQKYRISYDDIVNDLCPVLSVQQLYRICTQYWDDKYNTQSVSSSVLSSMRVLMTEDSNTAVSDAFLLDDNTSIIPFSADDISSSLQEKDFVDVKPATELLENPAFQFLQD